MFSAFIENIAFFIELSKSFYPMSFCNSVNLSCIPKSSPTSRLISNLGHPKAKAFITHGGTNGIYEAIYHGVPMVGVPMFADQPDNIAHMKAKGAAVEVNINTMTSADLLNALRTVINEPS